MFDFKFDWASNMETGYSDIDTQHKQLFKNVKNICFFANLLTNMSICVNYKI